MRFKAVLLFVSIVMLISSCVEENENETLPELEPITLTVKRLDQDLFETSPDKLDSLVPELKARYGDFLDLYCNQVLNIGSPDSFGFTSNLYNFVTEPNIKEVYAQCKYTYGDFAQQKSELEGAFNRYHYYFPDSVIPEIVVNVSGFNFAAIADEKTLGIGLEMFLGSNSIYYHMLGLPQYKIQFMQPQSLSCGAIKGWLWTSFPFYSDEGNVLSHMVYQGKILYALDRLFPETADSLKIDYTAAQMEFVAANEYNIWSHFIEQQALYSSDNNDLMKYMGEGPFTKGLPKEAPARLGEYIGWQIVKRFMKNNSDVSLQQLFEIADAQEILTRSKYKPDK